MAGVTLEENRALESYGILGDMVIQVERLSSPVKGSAEAIRMEIDTDTAKPAEEAASSAEPEKKKTTSFFM